MVGGRGAERAPSQSSLPGWGFTLWLGLQRKVQKIKEGSNQPE